MIPSGAGTFQMAFDATGNQYVAVETGSTKDGNLSGAILGWPPNATGNVAPTFQISGPNSGVGSGVRGIAFDAAGNLYASNLNDARTAASILVFAPGATETWLRSERLAARTSASRFPNSSRSVRRLTARGKE